MRINALFATSKVHFKRKQKHVYERNVCIITFFREDTPCSKKRLFERVVCSYSGSFFLAYVLSKFLEIFSFL